MAMDVVIEPSNQAALSLLAERILAEATTNPFGRHTVLVDSQAIGRNVIAGIAEQTGMAIGIEPQTLGQYFRQLVHCVETIAGPPTPPPAVTALPHQAVALAILQLLPSLQKSGSPSLKQHADSIANSHDTSSRLALASELARSLHAATEVTIDHTRWEPWVAELHKALMTHATASPPTTADGRLFEYLQRWPRLFAALEKLGSDSSLLRQALDRGAVPKLIFAFDPTLYPASPQARAIQLLATLTAVTVVLVDPQIRESTDAPSKAWSRRSRRPIEGVSRSLGVEARKTPDPGPAGPGGNALVAIQHSVAGEPVPAGPFPKEDRSVSIHHVPGDLRAAEIVRDTLHRAFVDMPDDLLPEHILVVSDDPRRDAPFIETAFDLREASKESLPVTTTGIRTRDWDLGVDAFLSALRLAPTSFAHDSVFQLLSMPPVIHGLRLDADEVAELSRACKNAGLLAYIDDKHREAVIGPFSQTDHGTWKAALKSLAMSMAMPDGGHEQVSVRGVVAAGGMQATQMDQLAALSRIIELLEYLRRLATGSSLPAMLNTAREITGALFRRAGRWKKSRDEIGNAIAAVEADAASAGFAGDIDYFWLAGELSRRLDRTNTSTRAMHGGVSLLEPSQARGRTPRVTVFLLSERFPTDDRPLWPEPFLPEYRGVQLRQYADLRDVFSVFMNTRNRAIFVVPSMSDRTYERLSVSSVVHDVRAIAESLQQHGVSFTEADESVAPHSVKSMQSTLPTRHRGAIRGAQALHAARTSGATQRPFAVMDLAHDVPEEVSLDRFIRFFEKPVETFLEHRSIYVRDTEDDYRLREMIWPDFLQRWQVRDAVYRLADEPRVLANLRATATLRADRVGADYLHDQVPAPTAVKAALARATETPIDVPVHYAIGKKKFRLRIHGSALIMDGEAHRYALGSLKARGWLALTTLEAVAIAANRASKARLHYIEQDKKTRADCHASVASDDPKNPFRGTPSRVSPRQPIPLVNLVRIWHLGHQTPLPLFSEEVQEALPPTAGAPGDLNAAITEFLHTDSGFGAGPGLDANVRAVFRGINPIRDTLYPLHAGVPPSDFERLVQFLSGNIPDAFPML